MMDAIYPIIETHYFTYTWFSYKGREAGWPAVIVRDFCFYHLWAPQGRLDDLLWTDKEIFEAAGGPILEGRPVLS